MYELALYILPFMHHGIWVGLLFENKLEWYKSFFYHHHFVIDLYITVFHVSFRLHDAHNQSFTDLGG